MAVPSLSTGAFTLDMSRQGKLHPRSAPQFPPEIAAESQAVGSPPAEGLASANTSELTSVEKHLSSLCQKRFGARSHPLGHRL